MIKGQQPRSSPIQLRSTLFRWRKLTQLLTKEQRDSKMLRLMRKFPRSWKQAAKARSRFACICSVYSVVVNSLKRLLDSIASIAACNTHAHTSVPGTSKQWRIFGLVLSLKCQVYGKWRQASSCNQPTGGIQLKALKGPTASLSNFLALDVLPEPTVR